MSEPSDPRAEPLSVAELRWRCDPTSLGFESTAQIEPLEGIVGQEGAVEALQFGLEIDAPGQNIYVRGLRGTGRTTLVRRMLAEIRPASRPAPDRLYVHDFDNPDRPKLITLPRGQGEALRDRIQELCDFITEELPRALDDELLQRRRAELQRATLARVGALTDPLEAALGEAGLGLMMAQAGPVTRPMVVPIIDGQPATPERVAALRAEGKLSDEDLEALANKSNEARERVDEVFEQVALLQRELRAQTRDLIQQQARDVLAAATADIRTRFTEPRVGEFLDAVIHDVATHRLGELDQAGELTEHYQVNLLLCHRPDDPPPVVVENAPSVQTLLGTIDTTFGPQATMHADHMAVRAGSLLLADGGVLIMEAAELVSQPGAWSALVRTLRTGRIELVPPDLPIPWVAPSLKPEPIEIDVKVVLLGDAGLYHLLDQHDADFPNLFKVLADFDSTIERTPESVRLYAGVLARIAREESLLPFDASAVAALAEHGARVAATRNKLTARFGRIADIAREASYLTRRAQAERVEASDVREAVARTKKRASGPARRFRELVADGTIRVATHGRTVGQINGLAVIHAGPLTYGFPTRITATIGPGTGGAINIERESHLSGAIHTKSFYILGGLLRHLLPTEHPLTFEASIAFEQSYGGIDGDSASGAEVCCLLSALTDWPIEQGLAMTGAIDQLGNVLPVGALNEKIEGFFDTCVEHGLSGTQGVVIPRSNVGDLVLRHDLLAACDRGEFGVYAVDHIREAIGIFFAKPAGVVDEHGAYAPDTVLHRAMSAATRLWEQATQRLGPDSAPPPELGRQAGGG